MNYKIDTLKKNDTFLNIALTYTNNKKGTLSRYSIPVSQVNIHWVLVDDSMPNCEYPYGFSVDGRSYTTNI